MEEKKELNEILLQTRKELEHDFSDEVIERIETSEIQSQVKRFKVGTVKPLINEIGRVAEIIKSPIHIGMLGRYSHGKSALVNALFSLNDDCKLPEGEGIVTSKVTHVSFDKDAFSPDVYEKRKTGELRAIDIVELRNCVGRSKIDNSTVDYYKMILPTDAKDFAALFAQKNINLVDMPGLGGQYFNDQVQTKRYIRELDMIIAVIKMNDILEAGLHINHLIETSSIPVIPVLTFADQWENSDLYADCKDLSSAVLKAREEIRTNIPALVPYIDNLIAVSALKGDNINELRGLILNNIETTSISIGKARKDISPVYKKQLREFQSAYSQLKVRLTDLCTELEKMLKPIVPQYADQQKNCVDEACKQTRVARAERNLREEANRSVNDLFAKYKDKLTQLEYVNDEVSLCTEIDRISQDTNGRLIREGTERISSCFVSYKDEIKLAVSKSIEKMTLDNRTKDNLKYEIETRLEEKKINCENIVGVNVDRLRIQSFIGEKKIKNFVSFFASMTKHPSSLVVLIIGILAAGCGAAPLGLGKILVPVGLALIAGSIIMHAIENTNDEKNNFNALRRKIVDYMVGLFDSNSKKDQLSNAITKAILEIKEEISDALSDDTSSYNNDARILNDTKVNIEESIITLSNKLEDELCEINSVGK